MPPQTVTPPMTDLLARDRALDVAAGLRREVDDHAARPHGLDHRPRDEQRSGPAGHGSGGDHGVRLGDERCEQLALPLGAVRRSSRGRSRHAPSSASRSSSTNLAPIERTSSADAARTSYASTTAPSRFAVAIACSPATPAPSTSTLAGGIVPAAVISSGRNGRELLGGDERGAVAGHQRLGGEGVHRLGPGDPRQQLHRERGDPARGERADPVGVGRRREEAGRDAAAAQPPDLLDRQRRDVQHDVDLAPGGAGGDDGRAGVFVRLVGRERMAPGAGLHHDGEAGLGQPRHALRNRGHPPLTGAGLDRDEDSHGAHVSGHRDLCACPGPKPAGKAADTHTSRSGRDGVCQTARP